MFRKRGSSIDLLAGRLASVVAYAFDLYAAAVFWAGLVKYAGDSCGVEVRVV